jgi:hypothetical protein
MNINKTVEWEYPFRYNPQLERTPFNPKTEAVTETLFYQYKT